MRTLILYFAALLLLVCCDAPKSKMRARLEYIDSLTYRENYGLADKTLDSINEGELSDDEDKALYYLLQILILQVVNLVKVTDMYVLLKVI